MSGIEGVSANGAGALAASMAAQPQTGGQSMMMMMMSSGDDDDDNKSMIMFASMSMGQQSFQASAFAAMDSQGATIGASINMVG